MKSHFIKFERFAIKDLMQAVHPGPTDAQLDELLIRQVVTLVKFACLYLFIFFFQLHAGHGSGGMGALLAGGAAAAAAAYGVHHLAHGAYSHGPFMHHGKFKHGKFKHGKFGRHGFFGKRGKHGMFGRHKFKKWK